MKTVLVTVRLEYPIELDGDVTEREIDAAVRRSSHHLNPSDVVDVDWELENEE